MTRYPLRTLSALMAAAFAIVSARGSAVPADAPPTYAEDIAPIIHENCIECHRSGGAGPFSLLTYDETRRRARQIAAVTGSRFMPPWLPEPGFGEFLGARHLTDRQIELIGEWAKAGAPEGDPALAPPAPPVPDEWPHGSPDLIVEMPEPFELPAGGADVYRNFVLAAPIDETFYVKGWHFRPGNPRAVHHAFVLADRSGHARTLDAADPGPGYGGMFEAELDGLDGFINGWAPGKGPVSERDGMAWRLEPGDDIVFQIHMQPTGKRERVQARVGLYRAEDPPTLHPEIVYLGSRSIDIPPGDSAYRIADDFLLPIDVEALAIVPHAHYVARQMRCWATLPDGTRRWLIRIDDWDLNWQGTFQYREPVTLPRGSRLHAEFVYDNSAANPRNPGHPPRRVRYGPESTDEMCEMWVQVLPRDPEEAGLLEQRVRRHFNEVVIEGLEQVVAREPGNAAAHLALGQRSQQGGNIARAIVHFREAVDLEPESARAHRQLADALAARGRTGDALEIYERAIALAPDDEAARFDYANTLRRAGRRADAIAQYRQVLDRDAGSVEARHNLAVTLGEAGRLEEALLEAREVARIEPDVAAHRYLLGTLLLEAGDGHDAVRELERAVELEAGVQRFRLHLAWVLATHPEDSVRDGSRARQLAEAVVSSLGSDPRARDTLAAAHAELGEFEAAVREAEKALGLARGQREDRLASLIGRRLARYRDGQPIRDP